LGRDECFGAGLEARELKFEVHFSHYKVIWENKFLTVLRDPETKEFYLDFITDATNNIKD